MKSVFISSTFKDMQAERDLLHERIFPRLRKIIGEYGEDIQELDLRWGVDTIKMSEEESGHKVLKVCIDAIDRCRPYIIVLLGERYGWIPELELVESLRDERVNAWYEEQMSITNLEIRYGALSEEETLKNCVFCFRSPKLIEEIDETHRGLYDAESPMHRKRLDALKEQIRAKKGAVILDYEAAWDKEAGSVRGLEAFGEALYELLVKMIRRDFAGLAARNPWEQLTLETERQKEHYLSSYVPRYLEETEILDRIALHKGVTGLSQQYFRRVIIKGGAGSGKSAMMASIAHTIREAGCTTILYFSGNSGCQSMDVLKSYLIYRLEEICKLPHEEETSRDERLRFLSREAGERKIYCLIDAVDQLLEQEAGRRLDLLDLCPNLYYVLSSLSDFPVEESVKTYPWSFVVRQIGELGRTERRQLISRTSARRGKKLDDGIVEMTVREQGAGNPLYLSMLLQRYFMMEQKEFETAERLAPGMEGLHRYMERLLLKMPDEAEPMVSYLLGVTGQRFGLSRLREILLLLAVSRYGLSEKELEGILDAGGMRFLQVEFQQLVSYLYDAFTLRENGKWTFAHRLFSEAVLHGASAQEQEAARELLTGYALRSPAFLEQEGFYYLLEGKHPDGRRVLEQAGAWRTKQEVYNLVGKMAVQDADSRAYFQKLTREVESEELWKFWLSFESDDYSPEFGSFLSVLWTEMAETEAVPGKLRYECAVKLAKNCRKKGQKEAAWNWLDWGMSVCQELPEPEKSRILSDASVLWAVWQMDDSKGKDWERSQEKFERAILLLSGKAEGNRELLIQDLRNKMNYAEISGYYLGDYLEEMLEGCLGELASWSEAGENADLEKWKVELHIMLTNAYQMKGHCDGEKSLAHGKLAWELSEGLMQKDMSLKNMELRLRAIEAYAGCFQNSWRYPLLEESLLLSRKIFLSFPTDDRKSQLAFAACSFARAVEEAVESRKELFPEDLRERAERAYEEGFALYEELLKESREIWIYNNYIRFLSDRAQTAQKRGYQKRALRWAGRGRELLLESGVSGKERRHRELDFVLAKALLELCRAEEALPYAKEAVEAALKYQELKGGIYRTTAMAWLTYAQVLYQLRRDEEALAACRETYAFYEGMKEDEESRKVFAELSYIESRICLAQGKLLEAKTKKKTFDACITDKKSWKYGQGLLLNADILLAEGEKAEAKAAFEEAYSFWCTCSVTEKSRLELWTDYKVYEQKGDIYRQPARTETGYYRRAVYYRLYSLYQKTELSAGWNGEKKEVLSYLGIDSETSAYIEWFWLPANLPAFAHLSARVPEAVKERQMPKRLRETWELQPKEEAERIAAKAKEIAEPGSFLLRESRALYENLKKGHSRYLEILVLGQKLAAQFQLEEGRGWKDAVLSNRQRELFADARQSGVRAWYPVLELCGLAYGFRDTLSVEALCELYQMSRDAFLEAGWYESREEEYAGKKTWDVFPLSGETLELLVTVFDDEKERASLQCMSREAKNTCVMELYRRTGEKAYIRRWLEELAALAAWLSNADRKNPKKQEEFASGIVGILCAVLTGNDGPEWAGEVLGYLKEHKEIWEVLKRSELEKLWNAMLSALGGHTGEQEALLDEAETFWQEGCQREWKKVRGRMFNRLTDCAGADAV